MRGGPSIMATTRIMPLHVGKGRTESRAISDIIDYVANLQKTDNGKLITGYACDRALSGHSAKLNPFRALRKMIIYRSNKYFFSTACR